METVHTKMHQQCYKLTPAPSEFIKVQDLMEICLYTTNLGVRVNQRIRFPLNVLRFPLSAPLPARWLYAESRTLRKTHMLIYPDP
jgi:hypothetical protein